MSQELRPQPTLTLVCDLCGEEMPESTYQGGADHRGSLTYGWIAHKVTEKTTHAMLWWPPASWRRTKPILEVPQSEYFDFHAECIYRLVKGAVTARGQ